MSRDQLDHQFVSYRDGGISLTAVPLYLWRFGVDWFQFALFAAMFAASGFSISLGYHRLFSHIAFQASWPVRLFTLIFGAGAFENSVIMWSSEHRRITRTSITTTIRTTFRRVFSTRTSAGFFSR